MKNVQSFIDSKVLIIPKSTETKKQKSMVLLAHLLETVRLPHENKKNIPPKQYCKYVKNKVA